MGTKISLPFLAAIVIAFAVQMITVSSSSPAGQPSAVPAPAPMTAGPSLAPSFAPSPVPVSSSPESAPLPAEAPAGNTYIVGDTMGWNLTEDTAVLYERWASNKSFNPGDILVFNFFNGIHDVLEVSKAGFESCNTTGPISTSKTSPTRIILTAGPHYYICGIPGHCTIGLKLAIIAGGPPPPPRSPTPSDVSSATPLRVSGLSAAFLSVINVALLFQIIYNEMVVLLFPGVIFCILGFLP